MSYPLSSLLLESHLSPLTGVVVFHLPNYSEEEGSIDSKLQYVPGDSSVMCLELMKEPEEAMQPEVVEEGDQMCFVEESVWI